MVLMATQFLTSVVLIHSVAPIILATLLRMEKLLALLHYGSMEMNSFCLLVPVSLHLECPCSCQLEKQRGTLGEKFLLGDECRYIGLSFLNVQSKSFHLVLYVYSGILNRLFLRPTRCEWFWTSSLMVAFFSMMGNALSWRACSLFCILWTPWPSRKCLQHTIKMYTN
jgi:hypothetical protein